jgi:hypothetical protein
MGIADRVHDLLCGHGVQHLVDHQGIVPVLYFGSEGVEGEPDSLLLANNGLNIVAQ